MGLADGNEFGDRLSDGELLEKLEHIGFAGGGQEVRSFGDGHGGSHARRGVRGVLGKRNLGRADGCEADRCKAECRQYKLESGSLKGELRKHSGGSSAVKKANENGIFEIKFWMISRRLGEP